MDEHFDAYVDALVSSGREDEVSGLIARFATHWDHNRGYGRLGTAAFLAGQRDIAEQYFIKLRDGLADYCRSEEMGLLAQIWHDRGETDNARKLLVNCLRKLVKLIQESKSNSDRKMFANEFQHHLGTFLRLFPSGESDLENLGIPQEPLLTRL